MKNTIFLLLAAAIAIFGGSLSGASFFQYRTATHLQFLKGYNDLASIVENNFGFEKTESAGCISKNNYMPEQNIEETELSDSDVKVNINVEGKTYFYQLSKSKSLNSIDESSLQIRAYYGTCFEKAQVIKDAMKLGFSANQALEYVLFGITDIINAAAKEVYLPAVDACAKFHPFAEKPFTYTQEIVGKEIDQAGLVAKILQKLEKSAIVTVTAEINKLLPSVTKQELVANTVLKSSFTTNCHSSSRERQNNIKLSMSRINGSIIPAGEILSFNEKVGKRTVENGFGMAKIIEGGEYVDGIGGGVCQASTTLFNACLLAGLTAKELSQHSLISSYIEPSFDAMVSEYSDLKMLNTTSGNVYIAARCKDGVVTVKVYGEPNKYKILRRSEVVEKTPANVKVIKNDGTYNSLVCYEDEEHWLTRPVDKVKSLGFLEYYKDGKLILTKKIRTNTYKPVEGVKVVGTLPRPKPGPETPSEEPSLLDKVG